MEISELEELRDLNQSLANILKKLAQSTRDVAVQTLPQDSQNPEYKTRSSRLQNPSISTQEGQINGCNFSRLVLETSPRPSRRWTSPPQGQQTWRMGRRYPTKNNYLYKKEGQYQRGWREYEKRRWRRSPQGYRF